VYVLECFDDWGTSDQRQRQQHIHSTDGRQSGLNCLSPLRQNQIPTGDISRHSGQTAIIQPICGWDTVGSFGAMDDQDYRANLQAYPAGMNEGPIQRPPFISTSACLRTATKEKPAPIMARVYSCNRGVAKRFSEVWRPHPQSPHQSVCYHRLRSFAWQSHHARQRRQH